VLVVDVLDTRVLAEARVAQPPGVETIVRNRGVSIAVSAIA